jgi:hypothetical protein
LENWATTRLFSLGARVVPRLPRRRAVAKVFEPRSPPGAFVFLRECLLDGREERGPHFRLIELRMQLPGHSRSLKVTV